MILRSTPSLHHRTRVVAPTKAAPIVKPAATALAKTGAYMRYKKLNATAVIAPAHAKRISRIGVIRISWQSYLAAANHNDGFRDLTAFPCHVLTRSLHSLAQGGDAPREPFGAIQASQHTSVRGGGDEAHHHHCWFDPCSHVCCSARGPCLRFLVSPNGSVRLGETTTLVAWEDGVERYITNFTFEGPVESFGSLIPLPAEPTDVTRAGDWTLQRLKREVSPPIDLSFRAGEVQLAPVAADVKVILRTQIDSLDVVVLKGGGADVLA